jgi:hypothetical protein
LISGLAKEVQKRMETVGVKGRRVRLKVKQRKKGAAILILNAVLAHLTCHLNEMYVFNEQFLGHGFAH